jgi:hypothetical protein
MKLQMRLSGLGPLPLLLLLVVAGLLCGCSTAAINWDNRVGVYSWQDALTELGSPDRVADLEGGVKAAEWITPRTTGRPTAATTPAYVRGDRVEPTPTYGVQAPDKVLRLSFTPDGKLLDWDRNY